MKKILYSLSMIAVVAVVVLGATGAFFSDTETSTGNTFTAGDIDLKIDNESYVTNNEGVLVASPGTSWDMADLVAGTHKFFDFSDLKPGDMGEDTISIHVGSNDAWMCAAARITSDLDNSITEPEDESGLPAGDQSDGTANGDLDSALNFVFWNDDGDNVYEPGTPTQGGVSEVIFLSGTLANMGAAGQITLADSGSSILGGNTPIPGDSTFYIGKAWCFGVLGTPGVTQDGIGKTGDPLNNIPSTNGPIQRPGGVACGGSGVNNAAQTDRVQGDMQFYAVQARNNPNFLCSINYIPQWSN